MMATARARGAAPPTGPVSLPGSPVRDSDRPRQSNPRELAVFGDDKLSSLAVRGVRARPASPATEEIEGAEVLKRIATIIQESLSESQIFLVLFKLVFIAEEAIEGVEKHT